MGQRRWRLGIARQKDHTEHGRWALAGRALPRTHDVFRYPLMCSIRQLTEIIGTVNECIGGARHIDLIKVVGEIDKAVAMTLGILERADNLECVG